MNPHLFRDCLATHVAIRDPEHVRIATTLLGHTKLSTTERYYNFLKGAKVYQTESRPVVGLPAKG